MLSCFHAPIPSATPIALPSSDTKYASSPNGFSFVGAACNEHPDTSPSFGRSTLAALGMQEASARVPVALRREAEEGRSGKAAVEAAERPWESMAWHSAGAGEREDELEW